MNITRVRDASSLNNKPVWHEDLSVEQLIVYTASTTVAAIFVSILTLKVLFRYNNCRW